MKENVLGNRIAELRRKRNMTQSDLAEKLEKSTSSIAMWEVGKRDPDSEMITKIANIFDVSTDYLLGLTDDVGIKQSSDQSTEPEIRAIQRAAKNMSKTDKKKMLNMIKAAFEEAFSEDD